METLEGNMALTIDKPLNHRQEEFCMRYATDPYIYGNATEAYSRVYKVGTREVAQVLSSRLMADPRITARINTLLSQDGFNDENVDKQHLFIINQHKDIHAKMKGIEHYNKLKKRVADKMELIIPRPIMELDDDEVIHKIDKSKAKDI
jgi:hypothetical protein